jgi:hypothetical protein
VSVYPNGSKIWRKGGELKFNKKGGLKFFGGVGTREDSYKYNTL